MKESLNPLVLSEYEARTISDNYMYENSIFHDVYPPIAEPIYETDAIVYQEYEKQGQGMSLEDFMEHWENTRHQTADSVIDEISQIEQDEKMSPEEKVRQIQHSYAHTTLEMLSNRDEMMKLVAYRADAMMWANQNIIDSQFVKEAIHYNPGAYEMTPALFKQRQDVIDAYRTTMFVDGPQQHPQIPERQRTPFDSIINQNCLEDKLYTHQGYKEVFTNVLLHQNQHVPYFDSTDQRIHATPAVKYLAHCEIERSDYAYDSIKKQAYQENKDALKYQAVRDAVVRENTAMFCYQQGLAPEPEWAKEFAQAHAKVQAAQYAKLNEVANRIFTEKGTGNYLQQLIYDVRDLQDKMPLETMEQRFNVAEFWQDVGQAVVEARARMKDNDYSSKDTWTRQEDRVFINEVKETINNNTQRAFVKENVNAGISHMRDEFQRQQDERSR